MAQKKQKTLNNKTMSTTRVETPRTKNKGTKEERNGTMEVYGCFCSPECAVGFLKNEKLDTSTIWERYALLNNIYAPIYKYNSNIKPAFS